MCGRIALYTPPERLARILGADLAPDVDPEGRPSYNVGPTRTLLGLVAAGGDGSGPPARLLERYRWGLVPSWAKDPSVGSRMFNARGETVAVKPSFRAAFKVRRLAVVVDGFYEWHKTAAGNQPHFFSRADGQPLVLAGLWETWQGPEPSGGAGASGGTGREATGREATGREAAGETGEGAPGLLRTCTVVTTSAGPDLAGIHDRMPVVLGADDLDEWLDPANTDREELLSLLVPAAGGTLTHHPVDRRVGNVRNDGPELMAPVDPPPAGS